MLIPSETKLKSYVGLKLRLVVCSRWKKLWKLISVWRIVQRRGNLLFLLSLSFLTILTRPMSG